MFVSKPEIINNIKKDSGNNLFDLVECRVKTEDKYNLYIFTIILDDQKKLVDVWKEICGDIAIYFQTDLERNIEIWNIYVLFLVEGSVDSQTRYLIEQNKYSSRKLVIEDVKSPVDKRKIDSIINEKLFNLNINYTSRTSYKNEPLSKSLETKYGTLFKVIKNNHREKPAVLLTKYLELLKNEF
ncbi:ABC-three component system middle component 1 [Robertmurraya sp. GLU-23]